MTVLRCRIDKGPGNFTDPQLQRIERLRQWRGDRAKVCKFQKIGDPAAVPLVAVRQFILSRKSLGGVETNLRARCCVSTVGHAGPVRGGRSGRLWRWRCHGERSLEGTFLAGCMLTGRHDTR